MPAGDESDIQRLRSQLHALTEVAKTLASPLDLPDLLAAVLDKITMVLAPAQAGAIMLWDPSSGLFRAEAAFGYDQSILKKIGLREGESITGKVFDAGSAILLATPDAVADAMSDMREANRAVVAQSLGSQALPISSLAVPLSVGNHKYGVLVLETLVGPARFTRQDIPFVQSLADLIALAIDRARLETRADVIREAQRAEKLRSEVMATLSHQLRMPLSAIKGYSTALLLDEIEWSKEKRDEFLRLIDEESDNMETMISEILDSSLIDVGQLILEHQPLRLPHLANELAMETQRRTTLHRLITDFPPDFPIIEADPRWIKQVFRNILDNAAKYSPEGGLIVIRGEVRANDVVISVSDQGMGISPEDLIPLFERYFRVKSPNGLNIPGTGLGLPIARSIIDAHGGRIWAESKLGEGTTIYFSLPLHRDIVAAGPCPPDSRRIRRGA